jgi:hypothetical protein
MRAWNGGEFPRFDYHSPRVFRIFWYRRNGSLTAPVNRTLASKLNPAVPRRYLFVIAGVLWTFAGMLLCIRGFIWLESFSVPLELALEALGAALAVGGYALMFSKVVKKNVGRISILPERACLFAFTAWRGYFLIALMITIGMTLRGSTVPKVFLSIPYTAMGGALLIGSLRFFREFVVAGAKAGS